MYTTLQFPGKELLCDFVDALAAKGIVGNSSENYQQFTYSKKDMSEEVLAMAKQFQGEKIS